MLSFFHLAMKQNSVKDKVQRFLKEELAVRDSRHEFATRFAGVIMHNETYINNESKNY